MNNEIIEIVTKQNDFMKSNCYLLINKDLKTIIIDPAGQECLSYIETNNLQPKYIILTHCHFDHIMYVNILREKYSIKVVCSSHTAMNIKDAKKNLSFFIKKEIIIQNPDIIVSCETELMLISIKIRILLTPGHTAGSICVYHNSLLFTGDALLDTSKPFKKLTSCNVENYNLSKKKIVNTFTDDVKIYPGHGLPFLLADYRDR